jgi:PiT family inorganic phosphate transporter
MSDPSPGNQNKWKTLDKDLGRILMLEQAGAVIARPVVAIGIALAFIVICALAAAAFVGAPNRGR